MTHLPRARSAGLIAAGLLLLAACGAGKPQQAASPSSPSSPTPTASVSSSITPAASPSPTVGASPCAAFPTNATMTIAGRSVRVASPTRPSSRVPVVIALAGYDQSAATLDAQAQLTARLGDRALVVVAEGLGAPLAWQFREGQTRDVDWLRAVKAQVTARCGDPQRVEIAGLSDGGVMAVRAACSLGVAALVTSSASAKPPQGCLLPRTMLAQHGRDDRLDPYNGDGNEIPPAREAIATWGNDGSCAKSAETTPAPGVRRLVYAACTAMHSVELLTLEGVGHGWPTGYDLTGRLLDELGVTAPTAGARAPFKSSIAALTAAMLPSSWRSGCPVPPEQLRRLSVSYVGFDGAVRQGVIDVNADVATAIVGVFKTIYESGYPIRQLRPVDDFGGSDDRSTTADNTSSFNCRQAVGGSGWSQHAYGHAIDIDPVENPYVDHGQVLPENGKPYVDRSQRKPGMIHAGDAVYNAFYAIGWKWGGHWGASPDYQHFSATGT